MRKLVLLLFTLIVVSPVIAQKKDEKDNIKEFKEKIQILETESRLAQNKYENISTQYQHTNDRLNNYLAYTGIIASIFGIIIALAGIYIGFESLRSQNRRKEAIKTLEEAKTYVTEKTSEFANLIQSKKLLLENEYEKITKILKEKLLSDIEIETSKVREIAVKKAEEIQKYSVEQENSKTIELLEKRLEFFENVGIPDDPEILFSKAKLLREKNMHNEAIILLEKLIEQVPEHENAYWHLGYEYAEIKDNDKSIKYYKKHIELKPNDSSALNNIALRYKAEGSLLTALEHLNKAIEISDKKELYYNNRIAILKKLNSREKVIEDYSKLITINPDVDVYYNEIIELLKKEKRNTDALLYYDKAINYFKERNLEVSNNFSFAKAYYLGDMENNQVAIEILQNLIDNNYKIEGCYIKIADLKSKLGKTEEAKSILNIGISNNPLSSSLYIYKAYIETIEDENLSKATIDLGGSTINLESYYFLAGRFFSEREKFALSNHCYEGALKIIQDKISHEEIQEIDVMNYYEINIILGKSLTQFNEKYRKLIVSEKYLIILTILDILNRLSITYSDEGKNLALIEIKKLGIEAKDKDLINWNFSDMSFFIKKKKDQNLFTFASNLINYIERKIKFEDL